MKRILKQDFILTALLVLSLTGCLQMGKMSSPNMSTQYRTDEHYLHPEFTLYNLNDTVSLLYFKIDESELLYVRRSQVDSFYASIKVFCSVAASYDIPQVQDSNSTVLKFASANNTKKEYAVGYIPLKIRTGSTHLLTITTYDMSSKRTEFTYLPVDKTNANSDQNFMLRDPNTGYIAFSRYADSAASYAILYNHPTDKLYVNFYRRTFPIAAPPFSTIEARPFQYRPDSSYVLKPDKNGIMFITLKAEGFYHIQADTTNRNGLTIYRFPKYFPDVKEVSQMTMPLRYITSNDEFEKIYKASNPKQAVDEFWLNTAGNTKERARSLIRNYYNRVQEANRYFTSYEPGWQTDRGMIYIIYGAPGSIYRSSTSEVWTYGDDKNYMAINFTFLKVNNPFTNNDYSLQRSQLFRNMWYNAVDVWREGRVY